MGSAPSPTARGTPAGRKMGDGWQTLVALAARSTAEFWEKSITPPGVDGMAANDTTTMHSANWRTFSPRRLKSLSNFSMSANWDPVLYTAVLAIVNVNTTTTVHFPHGDSLAFYGFLQSFKPGSMDDGKPPEVNIEVTPTNSDPSDCSEQAPTYTAGSGTAPC